MHIHSSVSLLLAIGVHLFFAQSSCLFAQDSQWDIPYYYAECKDAKQHSSSTSKKGSLPLPSFFDAKVLPVIIEVEGQPSFTDEELDYFPILFYDLDPPDSDPFELMPRVKRMIERDSYGQGTVLGPNGESGSATTFIGPIVIPEWSCSTTNQDLIDYIDDYVDLSPLQDGAVLMLFTPTFQCRYVGGLFGVNQLNSLDFTEETYVRWIKIFQYNPQTWLHELAHAFGAGHSGRTECTAEEFHQVPSGQPNNDYIGTDTCGSRSYANILGYMGNGSSELANSTHSMAHTKDRVGWLLEDPNAPHRVQTITTSGSYSFKSLSEENEEGVKALKFKTGMTHHLYLEVRQPYNQDQTPTFDNPILDNTYFPTVDASIFEGVTLSVATGISELLFDADRQPGEEGINDFPTWSNFVLPFNQVYTEPNSGTTIQVEEDPTTGTYLAHIELGRTDFDPPTISEPSFNSDLSEPCQIVLDYEIEDPLGIRRVDLIQVPLNDYLPAVPEQEILPTSNGIYRITLNSLDQRRYRFQLRASDTAGDLPQGFAPDNVSTNAFQLISELENQVGSCPDPDPEIIILSELNDEMPPSFPLQVDFVENVPIHFLSIQLTNLDTSEFFFIYGVSGLPETSHYVDLVLSELDVGSYRLSLATNVSYLVEFNVVDRLYRRGDANLDGVINIADVIKITAFLFQGDQTLFCQKAADTNDDGLLNIADAIYLSSYLFSGGPPPPEPFDETGQDPTEDSLSCY